MGFILKSIKGALYSVTEEVHSEVVMIIIILKLRNVYIYIRE